MLLSILCKSSRRTGAVEEDTLLDTNVLEFESQTFPSPNTVTNNTQPMAQNEEYHKLDELYHKSSEKGKEMIMC